MMFWTSAAAAYAYLTQMLSYKGFTENQIGIINAVKLFATVVFQIIIGAFSDRYAGRLPLKYIISFLTAAALVLTFIFYEYKLSFGQTILLFTGFGATFTCVSPLIDAMSIRYMKVGRRINYPVCRAAGSVAWAVACVLFGIFCDRYSANALLLLQMLFVFGMLLAAMSMEREKNEDAACEKKTGSVGEGQEVHSVVYLFGNYPRYTWFLVGSAVMFMGYNMGTTFLISVFERLGGSNIDYGIAEFVMAISEVPSAFILLKLRRRIPLEWLMLCCAVFMTFKNMFAAFSSDVWVIIVSQSCEMLGFGLFYAGSVYLIEKLLPSADVVKGMSLVNAFTVGAGEGLGSLACGRINSACGLTALMNVSVVVSAVSIVCMFIMCRSVPYRQQQRRNKSQQA